MRFARLTVAAAALAVATATLTPAVSGAAGPAAPTAQYRVTLKASTKVAVAKEDKVTLTGAVYPTPPEGSQVLVQVQYEKTNAWVKAGTAQVKKDGTYRFVDKPKTTRDRIYRVVKHGDKVAKQDKSRERALHVIGWSWLTDLIPSATENVFKAATMPINGDDYAHTLYVDRAFTTGFTEFTLGRDCTSLEATYGLSDRTETGGRAAISRHLRRRRRLQPHLRPRPVRARHDGRHRRLPDPARLRPGRGHPADRALGRRRPGPLRLTL